MRTNTPTTYTITFDNGDLPIKIHDADRAERLHREYKAIGVRHTFSHGDIPICPQCGIRECTYDSEPGCESYSTWCYVCFGLHAAAPWCWHADCSKTGTGHTQFTGEFDADGAALYLCRAGHFGPLTLAQHRAYSGVVSGEHDARLKLDGINTWLVECRLEPAGVGGSVAHQHPAGRAYTQAYVAAALATLAGDDRDAQR